MNNLKNTTNGERRPVQLQQHPKPSTRPASILDLNSELGRVLKPNLTTCCNIYKERTLFQVECKGAEEALVAMEVI
jgi:hypothetical protein